MHEVANSMRRLAGQSTDIQFVAPPAFSDPDLVVLSFTKLWLAALDSRTTPPVYIMRHQPHTKKVLERGQALALMLTDKTPT